MAVKTRPNIVRAMTTGTMPEDDALERFTTRVTPVMTVLALLWLPVLIIPFITTLHGSVAITFEVIDYAVWAAFVVEYAVKIVLAHDRWQFVRHNLLDLVVVAVPILRPLRLARVFRVVRLGRVGVVLGESLKRARAALTHHSLHYVLVAAIVIVFAAAAVETAFERHSHGPTAIHGFGEALWWAIVTVTTVGYGDRVPLTPGGQWVAVVLMLTGIGLVGFITATVASFFVQEQHASELAQMRQQLNEIRDLLLTERPS